MLYNDIQTYYLPPRNDDTTISMDYYGIAIQKGSPLKPHIEKVYVISNYRIMYWFIKGLKFKFLYLF